MIILLLLLRLKVGQIDGKRIVLSGAGATGASLVMGVVCYLLVSVLQHYLGVASKLAQLTAVSAAVFTGLVVFLGITYLLKLEELRMVIDLIGRRLRFIRVRTT